MNIVFVHGRNQQGKNPETLRAFWELSLRQGFDDAGLVFPKDLHISFPYYGDELDKFVKEIDAPLPTDVVARGATGDADASDAEEMEFSLELLKEIAEGAGIPQDRQDQEYDLIQPGWRVRGIANWGLVLAIVRALEGSVAGDVSIDAFTRDVYVYLTFQEGRRRINQIVANELAALPASEKTLVIGHSLGSVVAYDVLRSFGGVDGKWNFITVGSPLGINTIRTRLKPLGWPAPIKLESWFNARDPRDIVALRPLDETYFPINPNIDNKNTVDNRSSSNHGIDGYLHDIDVIKRIHALSMS